MAAWQFHPLLVVFQIGGLLSLAVALYCLWYLREHRRETLVVSVSLLAFHNAIWVFAASFKLASAELSLKLLFYKLEFLGSAVNPSVAVVLALAYLGADRWLTRPTIGALAAVPAVVVPLVIWNPGQLLIVEPVLVDVGSTVALEHRFTRLFGAFLLWGLGATLVASLIVGYGVGTGAVDRIPGTLVVLTLLLPVAVTTLKVTGIYPPGGTGINFTPAVNALSLVFLALAIVEFRLFDLLPAGRKRAVDVMTDGYVLLDETDTVVDTNRAAVSLLGADPDAALAGRALTDLVPESVAGDLATDGGAATFSVGGRVLQAVPSSISRDGEQAGRVLVLRDLTDQRARMEELTAKNERLQALFANTTAAVVEYVADDGEPIVVDVNAQFESLFGYNAARVVGRPLDEFVGPIADGTDATTLAAAIGRGENLSTEVERETVDGVRTFLLRHTPIDGTDDRRGYASYRDITERRADEQQLESQMTQLEVLNRIVRHDINNHMTVVLGMVAAARDDIDDPEVRDRLDRALRASENVTGLTTTARDLMQTMLSDGTEPEPVWLSHVLVDEIEDVQSAAADATIVVDGTLPNVQVMADDLLGSVFRNLLQNAVQHNDADTPTVRVGADATEKSVEITVADNGPGVPPERRETVFGKDEKGIASEGTGIGLYLVHSLVDSYGGEVWVTDNEPRGAVFHVRLERA